MLFTVAICRGGHAVAACQLRLEDQPLESPLVGESTQWPRIARYRERLSQRCHPIVERGEKSQKTPTPKSSALLRNPPVLLRANLVLAKDRKRPYYGHFCGTHREGSCSKAAGGP